MSDLPITPLLRLRFAATLADPDVRAELTPVLEYFEDQVGPTVRQADAARLLGVTQSALLRWVRRGEIASVRTPGGRVEIPREELLSLVEEVAAARDRGVKRPLAHVLSERRTTAEETVDVKRLLPARRGRSHRESELASLAYHRLVAEQLDHDDVERASRRVARWRAEQRVHPHWLSEWEHLLAQPLPRVAAAISADTTAAGQLRQTSPFAGMLTEQERRELQRQLELAVFR